MFSSTPQRLRSPHPLAGPTTPHQPILGSGNASTVSQLQYEGLENAGRLVDHHLKEDASFVELSGQLRIATHGMHGLFDVGQSLRKCNMW